MQGLDVKALHKVFTLGSKPQRHCYKPRRTLGVKLTPTPIQPWSRKLESTA